MTNNSFYADSIVPSSRRVAIQARFWLEWDVSIFSILSSRAEEIIAKAMICEVEGSLFKEPPPLKPKPGLNGPPAYKCLQAETNAQCQVSNPEYDCRRLS